MFVDRKYVRKSTGTDDRAQAVEFAKQFYDTVRINQRLDVGVHTDTFHACAQHLIRRQESLVASGQRDARFATDDRLKLEHDVVPFFGTTGVASVTSAMLDDYVEQLGDRKLSPATISRYLVVIRKVLKEALKRGFIRSLPLFPTIKRKDNPRPYFTLDEHQKLLETAADLATQDLKVRGVPLTREIWNFLAFHVNVFVRPSDLKELKHADIAFHHVKGPRGSDEYLSIAVRRSKTRNRESFTLPQAAAVYRQQKALYEERGLAQPDDFVFFPNTGIARTPCRRSDASSISSSAKQVCRGTASEASARFTHCDIRH